MKERPILFSAPMVRALLDGSKTQTRRIVKPQPIESGRFAGGAYIPQPKRTFTGQQTSGDISVSAPYIHTCCPYGQPGDRLWVRETWQYADWTDDGMPWIGYGADDAREIARMVQADSDGWGERLQNIWADLSHPDNYAIDNRAADRRWRPSIHMPRWACRIQLEIVSVRVERLNDCSEADAKAEGVMQLDAEDFERPMEREKGGWKLCPKCSGTGLHNGVGEGGGVIFDIDCRECDTHAKLYRHLWESINGADSWVANPWVWVVEFRRVRRTPVSAPI